MHIQKSPMHKFVLALMVAATLATVNTAATEGSALAVLVPGTGTYSRPISTDSKQAQAFFDQGLRLAWSFYFPESIASYQEAARLDPKSPMPYFGIAHAAGPNPNSRYRQMPDDPKGAGLAAITKARQLADNGTSRERDLINAVFVLYDKDTNPDPVKRDFAFLEALRQLHAKYPDDADIGTLFGEAYMNTTRWDYWKPDGSAKPGTAEAKAAFEAAMATEHDHPGANHLYIHLMEASTQPELALPSAQKLEAVAPIAGHMVHMPGHIYLRVGEYEKAARTNVRSQIVDQQFAEIWGDTNFPLIGTYPLSHKIHKPHALDFVRYANTLQGNYAAASEAARQGANSASADPAMINRGQKRIVQSWMVEKIFAKWDVILNIKEPHNQTPYLSGMWSYVKGSALVATGQLSQAEAELNNLRQQITAEGVNDTGVDPTPAAHLLVLAANGLLGELREAQGDLDGAIKAFAAAVELEDGNSYIEPPDWPQSMRLYLGAALLKAQRAEEAEAVYLKDLEWNQQSGWATFGLYQAIKAQGKTEEAKLVERRFKSYWRNADTTLKRSRL
ncbi:MAG: tetratricopeptide repeat protein [Porticoccaceae bacterium]|nr:tetratricopeptide repeat protein [Porticoccaceae bacterium]